MPIAVLQTAKEKVRFSARMKRFRKVHLLSREDVAELMGVHKSTIKNIELCNHGLSHVVMMKFREAQETVRANRASGKGKRVPR